MRVLDYHDGELSIRPGLHEVVNYTGTMRIIANVARSLNSLKSTHSVLLHICNSSPFWKAVGHFLVYLNHPYFKLHDHLKSIKNELPPTYWHLRIQRQRWIYKINAAMPRVRVACAKTPWSKMAYRDRTTHRLKLASNLATYGERACTHGPDNTLTPLVSVPTTETPLYGNVKLYDASTGSFVSLFTNWNVKSLPWLGEVRYPDLSECLDDATACECKLNEQYVVADAMMIEHKRVGREITKAVSQCKKRKRDNNKHTGRARKRNRRAPKQ